MVRFDQERGNSDGGAVLLAAADRRLGIGRTTRPKENSSWPCSTGTTAGKHMARARRLSKDTGQTQTPRWVYEKLHCQRGEIENRVKELHPSDSTPLVNDPG